MCKKRKIRNETTYKSNYNFVNSNTFKNVSERDLTTNVFVSTEKKVYRYIRIVREAEYTFYVSI